jgi:hypothetical protein
MFLCSISGCTSYPLYTTVRDNLPAIAPGQSRIWFFTHDSLSDGSFSIQVNLDRQKVSPDGFGASGWDPQETCFFVDHPPVECTVSIIPCGATDPDAELHIHLVAGETRYIEIYALHAGTLGAKLAANMPEPEIGRQMLEDPDPSPFGGADPHRVKDLYVGAYAQKP